MTEILPKGFTLLDPETPNSAALPKGFTLLEPETPNSAALPKGFTLLDPVASPPPATLSYPISKDLEAGVLAARQGFVGLGIAPAMSRLNPPKSPDVASTFAGTNADPSVQIAQLDKDIAEFEAAISDRELRADRAANRTALAEAQATRSQLMLMTGKNNANTHLADAQRNEDIASVLAGTQKISELGDRIADIPTNPAADAVLGQEDWGPLLSGFVKDPLPAVQQAFFRTVPAMAPTVAGATVAGITGGPLAAAVAGGSIGATTEFAMTVAQEMNEVLVENGIDPKDPEAVAAMLQNNPEIMDGILGKGAKRAAVIGLIDAVTGGVVTKIARGASGASKIEKVAATTTGGGVGVVGEGVGEAAALAATGEDVRAGEVFAEMIGAGPVTAASTATQIGADILTSNVPKNTTNTANEGFGTDAETDASPILPAPVPTTDAANIAPAPATQPALPEGFTVDTQPVPQPELQATAPQQQPTAPPEGYTLIDPLPVEPVQTQATPAQPVEPTVGEVPTVNTQPVPRPEVQTTAPSQNIVTLGDTIGGLSASDTTGPAQSRDDQLASIDPRRTTGLRPFVAFDGKKVDRISDAEIGQPVSRVIDNKDGSKTIQVASRIESGTRADYTSVAVTVPPGATLQEQQSAYDEALRNWTENYEGITSSDQLERNSGRVKPPVAPAAPTVDAAPQPDTSAAQTADPRVALIERARAVDPNSPLAKGMENALNSSIKNKQWQLKPSEVEFLTSKVEQAEAKARGETAIPNEAEGSFDRAVGTETANEKRNLESLDKNPELKSLIDEARIATEAVVQEINDAGYSAVGFEVQSSKDPRIKELLSRKSYITGTSARLLSQANAVARGYKNADPAKLAETVKNLRSLLAETTPENNTAQTPNWNEAVKTNPELRLKRPLTERVRTYGATGFKYNRTNPDGTKERTRIGAELEARGITPRTHPGLFNNKGKEAIDNLVPSEILDTPGLLPTDDTGNYLSEEAVLDAMAEEILNDKPFFSDPDTRQALDDFNAQEEAAARGDAVPTEPAADTSGTKRKELAVPKRDQTAAEFDPDYDQTRTSIIGSMVDETALEMDVETKLTAADRRAIIADLDKYGGDVGNAIYDHFEDKGTPVAPGASSEAAAQPDNIPFGPDDNAGTQSGNQATPTGNGRTSKSTEGFNSESTPAGEQTIVPGTEVRQTGEAQRAKAEADVQQQQTKLRRGNQTRVEDDEGGLFSEPETDLFSPADVDKTADVEKAQIAPKKSKGSSNTVKDSGTVENASYTNRQSIYRQAYTDAGVSLEEGNLMNPQAKMNLFAKLFKNKFGITLIRKNAGRAIDAVENALDGYRNLQFMARVMGMPLDALGLNNTLNLSMDKANNVWRGKYVLDTNTIHMPGRSNSFAHEWMHAADHYISRVLAPSKVDNLLSRTTRNTGIEVDPADGLADAWVNLVHTLFFDEASLANNMLRLEREAGKTVQKGPNQGKPTKKALEAQKSLKNMARGATRVKVDPSPFRDNAISTGSEYYSSVHELMARAFEAYIAHRMEVMEDKLTGPKAKNSNEFVTKGDKAYLNAADAEVALLYPQAADRVRIFAAFEQLFLQMDDGSSKADRPSDTDIVDAAEIARLAMLDDESMTTALKEEWSRVRNMMKNLFKNPRAALKSGASTLAINSGTTTNTNETRRQWLARVRQNFGDTARYAVLSMRGATKAIIKRQPQKAQAFLQLVLDKAMTDHGSGRNQLQTFEEAREMATNEAGSKITRLLKSLKLNEWTTGRLNKKDNDNIRGLLLGKKVRGATSAQRKMANLLRDIMNETYRKAMNAGIEMGYVEDTGYIPRVLQNQKVMENRLAFEKDAEEVYQILFDQEADNMSNKEMLALAQEVAQRVDPLNPPFSQEIEGLQFELSQKPRDKDAIAAARADLEEAIRDDYASTSAKAWAERVVQGDSMSFDSLGPSQKFTNARKLPKEADDILENWYDTDVLVGTLNYVHGITARAEYNTRFGAPGTVDKLDVALRGRKLKADVFRNQTKYNRNTPAGRLAIMEDLLDPKLHNIKEIALNEAVKNGADTNAVTQTRDNIEEITGRKKGRSVSHMDRFSAGLYALGYIALLPKAAWSSVVEPTTILIRTGSVTALKKTYQQYIMEAVRGAKTTKEIQAIAEFIGLVSTPLHDTILLNRLSGDQSGVVSGNSLMTRFFRANGLSQITNAQRRASMVGGNYWFQDLAKQYRKNSTTMADRARIETEFNEVGLGGKNFRPMLDFLASLDGLPSLEQLQTPEGKLWGAALGRFVDQTIQNPRRADKPMAASSAFGRMVYGIMSFSYTFFSNVHAATAKRMKSHYKGAKKTGDKNAWVAASEPLIGAAAGLALLYAGQLLVGTLRAAIYNADQWEEKEEKDELASWLGWTAFSRTGFLGPADVLANAMTGLRYERDLTSLLVGAVPSWIASNFQNIIKGMPQAELYEGGPGVGVRNSENTNTAEWTGSKSAYNLFATPSINAFLSAMPTPGPVGWGLKFGAMQLLSSSTAAAAFADMLVGEKGEKADDW